MTSRFSSKWVGGWVGELDGGKRGGSNALLWVGNGWVGGFFLSTCLQLNDHSIHPPTYPPTHPTPSSQ